MQPLPGEFETIMRDRLAGDFEKFCKSLSEPPPTSIRLNSRKAINRFEKEIPWTSTGFYLEERPTFTLDPHFHAGNYYVQEASSMFVEQALRQHARLDLPLNVLDLCAAPGGKSTHILNLINERSLLVSNEVIRSRASILTENLLKWGYPNSIVTNNDPEDFSGFKGVFDVVVVDAPCSGEGLFRKEQEAMSEWSPANVDLCSARQKRIISEVWSSLKTGGLFIYCTCTYNERENEQNLAWLASQHGVEFLRIEIEDSWNIEEVSAGNAIGYRFYPHRVQGEGFFLSVIRKLDADDAQHQRQKRKIDLTPKKNIQILSDWISANETFTFFDHENVTRIITGDKFPLLESLASRLKIVNAGTPIAEFKHDKAIPEHALALSIVSSKKNFNSVSVDYDDAIRYLRRDSFVLPETGRGYCLVEFERSPLGFVNNLGNRFNNLYPVEWRIRMQANRRELK